MRRDARICAGAVRQQDLAWEVRASGVVHLFSCVRVRPHAASGEERDEEGSLASAACTYAEIRLPASARVPTDGQAAS
jgi:hypothetical protein